MFIGIAFLLFYFKMSGASGLWTNMRNTDNNLYKTALHYQRELRILRKCQLDLRYLYRCVENQVYAKFIKWTNVKRLRPKQRESYCKRILQDTIREKKVRLKELQLNSSINDQSLRQCTTWMKYHIIKFSINRLLDR